MQKFEKHSPVVVTEVTTKHELRQFMQYPNRLYADNPNYIPSFYGDDLSDWTPGKNPAFDYCEARCWLARRDGEIVGRIGAILSHKANDKFGTHRMRFSQVDFVDDSEVSAALFGTVERWAREKGCDQVHGPLGFTDMDREGMLVEGFDRRSLFFTNYNAPYYLEHLTRLGYRKDVDWIEYRITVPEPGGAEAERLHKLSEFILKRKHLHVATVHHKSEYGPFVRQVFELVNAAYAPLYGVVELSDEQIERYAAESYSETMCPVVTKLKELTVKFTEMQARVEAGDKEVCGFKDFHARRLVETAGYIIITYLLARQAGQAEEYVASARVFCKLAESKIAEAYTYVMNSTTEDVALFKAVEQEN